MYSNNFKSRQDHSLSKDKVNCPIDSQNTEPKSKQKQILKRFYQTQNFSKLINQGHKKIPIKKGIFSTNIILNTTPRNVTSKTNHINQEYYFVKQQQLQTTHRLSEHISKTLSSVFNKPNQNSNREHSQNKLSQTNTDRKNNGISLDSTKLIQKRKTENQEYKEQKITTEKTNNKKHSPLLYNLDDFVTQVQTPNLSKSKCVISPFKQAKSLSPTNGVLTLKKNNNIYYVSAMCELIINQTNPMNQIFQDHAIQTFNSIDFCVNQQEKDISQIQEKMIKWPKQNTKFNKTIVFDLDETLIHCNENHSIKSDILLPITFPSGEIVQASINIRPWAREILQKLSEVCEVAIFTASHKCYAQKVIELLDKSKVVSASLFRDHCIVTNEGVHIKDLRILGRDMKDIVLIDNAVYSFGIHIENGIPIIPYYDNKADNELKQLYDFLITNVLPSFDCRKVLQNTFRLREFANYITPKIAIKKLYF